MLAAGNDLHRRQRIDQMSNTSHNGLTGQATEKTTGADIGVIM